MGKYSDTAKPMAQSKELVEVKVGGEMEKSPNGKISKPSGEQEYILSVIRLVRKPEQRSSNYKLSESEKDRFDTIVLDLKKQGFRRMTNNLLIRISLDLLLDEYERKGKHSTLYIVLQRMYQTDFD